MIFAPSVAFQTTILLRGLSRTISPLVTGLRLIVLGQACDGSLSLHARGRDRLSRALFDARIEFLSARTSRFRLCMAALRCTQHNSRAHKPSASRQKHFPYRTDNALQTRAHSAFLPNFVQRVEKRSKRGSIATDVLRVRCQRFDGGLSIAGPNVVFATNSVPTDSASGSSTERTGNNGLHRHGPLGSRQCLESRN